VPDGLSTTAPVAKLKNVNLFVKPVGAPVFGSNEVAGSAGKFENRIAVTGVGAGSDLLHEINIEK
jgi:hypothetical protein